MSDAARLPDPRRRPGRCIVCGQPADGFDARRHAPVCETCADLAPRLDRPDLSVLTAKERDAWLAVHVRGIPGREYARATERSWGTVSNLLMRAREKLETGGVE